METAETKNKTKFLLTQNSKLKKTSKKFGVKVYNFGIPAYKTQSGKVTCPFAKDCIKFCYARKGAYAWSNVKPAFERRYEATKKDNFVEVMIDEIKRRKIEFVRVHDSGDFYSREYRDKWFKIANQLPNVNFYAYTNSIEMFKELQFVNRETFELESGMPFNFDIIFSDSGKQVELINKAEDKHTKIFKSLEELKNEGYVDCSEYDLYATKWFSGDNKKVGLVIH